MMHDLKILERFADAVVDGRKTFEVRRDDRGFVVDDIVFFRCIDDDGMSVKHAIDGVAWRITYVLSEWGIKDGFVVFGVERITPWIEPVHRRRLMRENVCVIDEEIVEVTVKEPVVRCRDCRLSAMDGTRCALFASCEPILGGTGHVMVPADVDPYGFCAWGERVEVAK